MKLVTPTTTPQNPSCYGKLQPQGCKTNRVQRVVHSKRHCWTLKKHLQGVKTGRRGFVFLKQLDHAHLLAKVTVAD